MRTGKFKAAAVIGLILSMAFSTQAFALTAYIQSTGSQYYFTDGNWVRDSAGWKFEKDPNSEMNNHVKYLGSYNANEVKDGWYWIDGDGDDLCECYYFDATGHLLTNSTPPESDADNYVAFNGETEKCNGINANGAFTVDGTVVSHKGISHSGESTREERLEYLEMYCGHLGMTEEEKKAKGEFVMKTLMRGWQVPENHPITMQKLTEFLTSIDWPNMTRYQRIEACYNRVACDNGEGVGYPGNMYSFPTNYKKNGEDEVFGWQCGVCGNYQSALLLLLRLVGVEGIMYNDHIGDYAHGDVRVKIGETWYQLDPTNPESRNFADNLKTLDDPWVTCKEPDSSFERTLNSRGEYVTSLKTMRSYGHDEEWLKNYCNVAGIPYTSP